MIFVAVGTFILGCVVGWFLHRATLFPMEIVFDDGVTIDGYLKEDIRKKVDE